MGTRILTSPSIAVADWGASCPASSRSIPASPARCSSAARYAPRVASQCRRVAVAAARGCGGKERYSSHRGSAARPARTAAPRQCPSPPAHPPETHEPVVGLHHDRGAGAAASGANLLPDFLGDERHQWMQGTLQGFEISSSVVRAPLRAAGAASADCSTGLVSSRYQSQNSYQVNCTGRWPQSRSGSP